MSNLPAAFLNNRVFSVQTLVSQRCLLCHARCGPKTICRACDADLPHLAGALCRQCATPLPTSGSALCGACLAFPPKFDRIIAPFAYRFPIDALIHALKYGKRLVVARFLASALAPLIDEPVDVVVPVPLSDARLRERGFNQAHEIARCVGHIRKVAIATSLCRRVADTPPQATLPWKERARNVRGAFVCDAEVKGLCVAVVDDVATTGATLNEISRVLKRAGAAHVSGWCAARALRQAGGCAPAGPQWQRMRAMPDS